MDFFTMGALSIGKGLLSGLMGGSAANRQIANQYRQIEQQNLNVKAANETVVEQNKAIQEYNKRVMLSAAETVSQINLQRTYETKNLTATLFNVQSASVYQQKQAEATYAAADTIGATVKDAAASVNIGNDRLAANAQIQFEQVQEGLNKTLSKAMDEYTYGMKEGIKGVNSATVHDLGGNNPWVDGLIGAGFAALDTAGSYYANTYFQNDNNSTDVLNNMGGDKTWYSPKPTYKQNFGSRLTFFE